MANFPHLFYRLGRKRWNIPNTPELYYVVPNAGWSTDWDGCYITRGIHQQFGWATHITFSPHILVDHILHYGELGTFLSSIGTMRNRNNIIVSTIFHGNRNLEFPHLTQNTEKFLAASQIPRRILTSCQIMKKRLITWGVPPEKVVCIPLGVDLKHFKPPTFEQRLAHRHKMGIPENSVCVGSFQKDGVGWGDGLTPKLIKGPDIFLQVIERLHKHYNLFVLLTGPSRGYIKQGLDALSVPYRHEYLSNYLDIATMYHSLDLYLVTSREEGGPKAVLESLASGVPLISTRVGLAPDIIQHGHNGLLVNLEDVDALAEQAARLIEHDELRGRLIANGLADIVQYDWKHIATRYYKELYLPLLNHLYHG